MTCTCGNREDHNRDTCRVADSARRAVLTAADQHDVDRVTALDLWAHLRKGADPQDAAVGVTDALDLGWRPCVTVHTHPTTEGEA